MATYKDGSTPVEGDKVIGVDKDGKPVSGILVMIHRHTNEDLADIAVVQSQKLIGDLKSSDFTKVSETPAPKLVTENLPAEKLEA